MKLPKYLWQELASVHSMAQAIQQQMTAKSAHEDPSDEELQALTEAKVRIENILLETDSKELSKSSKSYPELSLLNLFTFSSECRV